MENDRFQYIVPWLACWIVHIRMVSGQAVYQYDSA